MRDFIDIIRHDHIYTKNGKIRALSPLWWVIRVLQAAFTIACLWSLYILMWIVLG